VCFVILFAFSAFLLLGEHPACKNLSCGCWHGYLSGYEAVSLIEVMQPLASISLVACCCVQCEISEATTLTSGPVDSVSQDGVPAGYEAVSLIEVMRPLASISLAACCCV